VTATYLVNPTYPTSSGTTSQVVGAAPAAEAGGPYSVAEGGSLILAGSPKPSRTPRPCRSPMSDPSRS
jgi:hypothetical protein